MDRLILDFEQNTVEWDSDAQRGTEHFPGLQERKAAILAAMGYKTIDMSGVFGAVNDFMNGVISEEAFRNIMDWEADNS